MQLQKKTTNNNCLISSVIYKANVTTDKDDTGKNYIGLTEGIFKQRYTQHKLSFRNRKYANRTEIITIVFELSLKKNTIEIFDSEAF